MFLVGKELVGKSINSNLQMKEGVANSGSKEKLKGDSKGQVALEHAEVRRLSDFKREVMEGMKTDLDWQKLEQAHHEFKKNPVDHIEKAGEGKPKDALKAIQEISDNSFLIDVPEPFRCFYKDGKLDLRFFGAGDLHDSSDFVEQIYGDESKRVEKVFSSKEQCEEFAKEFSQDERKFFLQEHERFSKGVPNCYASAFGLNKNPYTGELWEKKPQPGVLAGRNSEFSLDLVELQINHQDTPEAVRSCILEYVKSDCEKLGCSFVELKDYNDAVPPGYRRIFLSYSPSTGDYHWHFETPFGDWYHKPGVEPLRCFDNSGKRILDPSSKACNSGYYTQPIGFFAIKERK